MKSKIFSFIKITLIFLLIATVVFGVYLVVIANAAELNIDKIQKQDATLVIYDVNGNEIELYEYQNNVTYDEIPKNLINAFVCIEDKNYFSHNGVDAFRIIKALVKNLISFSPTKEGASTITQQLIKNTQLSNEKSITRKVQEIKLALELEGIYTKEEIITAYLNVIYFGNSLYGVKSASMEMFGKDCKDLTLAECATLAGIVKSPARYSPLRNYQKSLERRNFILNEMAKDGYVSQDEANDAIEEEIKLNKNGVKYGNSFVSAVIDEATQILGITENELAYGGYKIYTAYDVKLQKNIENYFIDQENIAKTADGNRSDFSALVCDNEKGLISAYHSTYKGDLSDFYRQPGSVIKPFVSYLPQLSNGTISPATPVLDEKKDFNGYSPSNFGNKYLGWTNMRTALSKSLNSVAVENFYNYGINNSINYASAYGIKFENNDKNLPTALGGMTKGVTPIDISSAYMTIANGGYYRKVGFVEYITNFLGENIHSISSMPYKAVENEEATYLMTDMLYDCVNGGTSSRLQNDNYKIAAKTGTVSNAHDKTLNNDIWNLSFTGEHTVCVWMGNSSNSVTSALTNDSLASIYPTEAAKNIYNALYENYYPVEIPIPENVQRLPYSKMEYENEHVLYLADEFYTQNEVEYDLFNLHFLPEIKRSELENVDIQLNIEIKQGYPVIEFFSQEGLEYRIKKSLLLSGKDFETVVVGNGKTMSVVDKEVFDGYDYVYVVDVYLTNHSGDNVYLKSSEEFFISVPFNFWNFS